MKKLTLTFFAAAVAAVFTVPANAYGVIWEHSPSAFRAEVGNIGVLFNLRNRQQARNWAGVQCERSRKKRVEPNVFNPGSGHDCSYSFFEKECVALGKITTINSAGGTEFRTIYLSGSHDGPVASYYRERIGDFGPDGHRYGPPSEAHARKSWADTCVSSGGGSRRACDSKKIRAGCDTNNSGDYSYGTVQTYNKFIRAARAAKDGDRLRRDEDTGYYIIEQ